MRTYLLKAICLLNVSFYELTVLTILCSPRYRDLSCNRLPYTYVGKRVNDDCYLCSVKEAYVPFVLGVKIVILIVSPISDILKLGFG